jgi:hypothetical protein
MTFIPHVIDGQESESASGARFASVDPGDGWVVLPTVVENARRAHLPRGGVRPGGDDRLLRR